MSIETHKKICDELHDLYVQKNEAYGDSFAATFAEEGEAALRIRLTDKLNRYKTLSRAGRDAAGDERKRDTLIDLANYAIMGVAELDKRQREEPAEKDGLTGTLAWP